MKNDTGKKFYEATTSIHNILTHFEFTHQQCHKLGRVECNLLQFLLVENRPLSMKEIAQYMNVSHSRITHLMDSLIGKDYIKRLPSEEDRRVYFAQITQKGIENANRYRERNIKLLEELINSLPQEEQEKIFESLDNWKHFLIRMRREMREIHFF
ncbi:MAG: MarR family transcriptional regulator [Candidatus Cloacimonetes bacterium]|jgi:MarR family 2-MHQ and catechol resistance regulon transcriptional repressor|nr:MarR family transcriptional regulator [Candidatus Cloacimonadota bacterium]MDD4155523.1 MarR family transcriptional regulator [Candidatus Cloacimonadota bacterium]